MKLRVNEAIARSEANGKKVKMVDVFFSDAWQAKVFAMIFSIFGVICFIAGFWNYIHFLFSAMCGLMVYVLFNELKSK